MIPDSQEASAIAGATRQPLSRTLGGSNSSVTSISKSGLIAGESQTASGGLHAVLWKPADTTPPTLKLPAAIVVDATSAGGAVVGYTVNATDDVDPNPTVVCAPTSGSVFPIGTTTVTCTATDASGNGASGSFTVTVKGAGEQVADLAAAVKGVGPGKSLGETVAVAQWFLAHRQSGAACLTLTAFQFEVRAQSGKKTPAAQAASLIADASRIKSVLDCTK